MAGGVAQVVKCLPSKREVLSLNPSITKKRKERKKSQIVEQWWSNEASQ
jgi:hypothetical protein